MLVPDGELALSPMLGAGCALTEAQGNCPLNPVT